MDPESEFDVNQLRDQCHCSFATFQRVKMSKSNRCFGARCIRCAKCFNTVKLLIAHDC